MFSSDMQVETFSFKDQLRASALSFISIIFWVVVFKLHLWSLHLTRHLQDSAIEFSSIISYSTPFISSISWTKNPERLASLCSLIWFPRKIISTVQLLRQVINFRNVCLSDLLTVWLTFCLSLCWPVCLTDLLIDWLIDWLIEWVIDWLIDFCQPLCRNFHDDK